MPDAAQLLKDLNSRRRRLSLGRTDRHQVSRSLVKQRAAFEDWLASDEPAAGGSERTRNALRLITDLVVEGRSAEPGVLIQLSNKLHGNDSSSGQFRQTETRPLFPSHQPLRPKAVERAVERFFEWIQSPGFGEIHPAAQMAVVQARLLEIHPFDTDGYRPATIFSSFFPLSCGLLLPVPPESSWEEWKPAVESALGFATEPLTRWNLQACLHAYELALVG